MDIGTTAPTNYPEYLYSDRALDYLEQRWGIRLKGKTLRNKLSAGTGPKCRYFGNRPVFTVLALDEFAECALTDRPANHRQVTA